MAMDVKKRGEKTRVVVVGGGHAGFHAARRMLELRKPSDNLEIIVASSETSEVYHGMMPQIVGGRVQARNLLVPLRNYLPGVAFYHYEVERIDLKHRKVYLDPVAASVCQQNVERNRVQDVVSVRPGTTAIVTAPTTRLNWSMSSTTLAR